MTTNRFTISTVWVVLALATAFGGAITPAVADDRFDTVFAHGHQLLDQGKYRQAAEDFARAGELAGTDEGRAEASYWRAFALQRAGGKQELRAAATQLQRLQQMELKQQLRAEAQALAVQVKAELARQGDAEAARELAQAAGEQDDLELKLAAIQAMMHMNPEKAVPVLEKIVQDRRPERVELRRQAMFVLSQTEGDAALEIMIDAAHHDPDPEVRQQAVFWLGQTGSPEALDFFRDVIRQEQDQEVVEQALFALSQLDLAEANGLIREIAADPSRSVEVREHAIFGLGHNGTRADREFLRQMFGTLTEPELQEQVLFAVAQHDDPESATWMMDIATDPGAAMELRKTALFWAGQQGLVSVSQLREIYDTAPDMEMREQIIFVLAQDGGPEAVDVLMTIARTEEAHELRKQAVFWIGQNDVEGAEDLLLEIINE